MKTFDKVLLIIGAVLIFIAGFAISRWTASPCPEYTVKDSLVTQTIETKPLEPIKKESKKVFHITNKINDSIVIEDSTGRYEAKQSTEIRGDSVHNKLELTVKPVQFIVKQFTLREITKTVIEYLPEPFYSNTYFWLWIFQTVLTVLAIVF